MKSVVLCVLMFVLAIVVWPAERSSKTEIQDAIKKLAAQPNYSWVSTVLTAAPTTSVPQGPTEGKTERDGFTYFRLNVGDSPVEAALHGSKSAIKTDGNWEAAGELQGDRQWMARRLSTFKAPVAESEELLAKSANLKREKAGIYSGDLTSEGVRELLSSRSRTGDLNSVRGRGMGTVRFWIQNGSLAKYEFRLQGQMISQGQQIFDVDRTTTVEIKDAGSTRVQVPEEAKKKLQ